MEIERTTAGDVTILAFVGEFEAYNVETVNAKLAALIDEGVKKFVFNQSRLKFIDSSALGCLISTSRRLTAR